MQPSVELTYASALKINMKDMMEKIIPAMKHEPIFVKLGQEE